MKSLLFLIVLVWCLSLINGQCPTSIDTNSFDGWLRAPGSGFSISLPGIGGLPPPKDSSSSSSSGGGGDGPVIGVGFGIAGILLLVVCLVCNLISFIRCRKFICEICLKDDDENAGCCGCDPQDDDDEEENLKKKRKTDDSDDEKNKKKKTKDDSDDEKNKKRKTKENGESTSSDDDGKKKKDDGVESEKVSSSEGDDDGEKKKKRKTKDGEDEEEKKKQREKQQKEKEQREKDNNKNKRQKEDDDDEGDKPSCLCDCVTKGVRRVQKKWQDCFLVRFIRWCCPGYPGMCMCLIWIVITVLVVVVAAAILIIFMLMVLPALAATDLQPQNGELCAVSVYQDTDGKYYPQYWIAYGAFKVVSGWTSDGSQAADDMATAMANINDTLAAQNPPITSSSLPADITVYASTFFPQAAYGEPKGSADLDAMVSAGKNACIGIGVVALSICFFGSLCNLYVKCTAKKSSKKGGKPSSD